MEEIFPLNQMNLLSESSRYAYDSLITSQFLNGNAKSNAYKSNSNTNINTTCNNNTCSPSKRHRESLRRQGTSHSGTLKSTSDLFDLNLKYTKKQNSKCKKHKITTCREVSHTVWNSIKVPI